MTTQQSSRTTPAARPGTAERFAARGLPRRGTAGWSRSLLRRRRRLRRPGWSSWSRRRLLLCAVTVVLLAAAAAWAVLLSPLLAVRTITVTGLPAPAAASAQARAAAALGQPILRVDTRALAAQMLGAELESVTVSRSYPSTLLVRAVPRVAVLAARNPQGQVEVWDRYGVSMGSVTNVPAGVPLLEDTGTPLTPQSVRTLTAVLQSLSATARRQVSHIAVTPIGLVSFRMGSVRVTWGDAGDAALKARLVDVLVRQAKSGVDVSAPRTPAVR